MQTVAIIGAGLSGLTLAHELTGVANVKILEKSRGVGGRMATRRSGGFEFDHGAQYFTAKSEPFRAFVEQHRAAGVLEIWRPELATLGAGTSDRRGSAPFYLPTPAMNALGKSMARDLDIKRETQITGLERSGRSWFLVDDAQNSHGPFDWVVSTAPAAQTEQLLPSELAGYDAIRDTKYRAVSVSCWDWPNRPD